MESPGRGSEWDGTQWSSLPGEFEGPGNANLQSFVADGTDLYVGGRFETIDEQPFNGIAKWDGNMWTSLGSGVLGGSVSSMALHDRKLYVTGGFDTADLNSSSNFGIYHLEPLPDRSVFIRLANPDFSSSGEFRVRVLTEGDRQITMQTSADLVTWLPLTTETTMGGVFDFVESISGSPIRKFYRAALEE